MIRSIEQILGLSPMNQNDAAAAPMSELFTDKPDFTPYDFAPNRIALDTLNGQEAIPPTTSATPAEQETPETKDLKKHWSEWSDKNKDRFSGKNASPDKVNANMLNHVIWYATKGYDKPYPGDEKVHTPDEVAEQPESKD
jgi:hypothetical protein